MYSQLFACVAGCECGRDLYGSRRVRERERQRRAALGERPRCLFTVGAPGSPSASISNACEEGTSRRQQQHSALRLPPPSRCPGCTHSLAFFRLGSHWRLRDLSLPWRLALTPALSHTVLRTRTGQSAPRLSILPSVTNNVVLLPLYIILISFCPHTRTVFRTPSHALRVGLACQTGWLLVCLVDSALALHT